MNRLIIIGNGFDLAHGYKTSYTDFMEDYFSNVLTTVFTKKEYEDELIKFNYYSFLLDRPLEDFITIEKSFKYIELIRERFPEVIKFKSDFFKELYTHFNHQKWIDIENDYFSYLKRFTKASSKDIKGITKVNIEFEFLKTKLIDYLKRATKERISFRDDYLTNLIANPFIQEEFVDIIENHSIPRHLYFLNFNYTITLEKYITSIEKKIRTTINYIHGDIHDDNNPVIFGYGDEHDADYLEIEKTNIHELLQHIKSFQYSKTSNYHNLMRFIQAEPFQVYVFGHSLGLSDRTMLKEIFEHQQCKSIKLFYHQKNETENDFTEKVYELANHFTDKGLMRKKLVPFDKSTKI